MMTMVAVVVQGSEMVVQGLEVAVVVDVVVLGLTLAADLEEETVGEEDMGVVIKKDSATHRKDLVTQVVVQEEGLIVQVGK